MQLLTPPELMTAAERAGYRMACEKMRRFFAQVEDSGRAIGDADLSRVPRGELMAHCGRLGGEIVGLVEAPLNHPRRVRLPQMPRGAIQQIT